MGRLRRWLSGRQKLDAQVDARLARPVSDEEFMLATASTPKTSLQPTAKQQKQAAKMRKEKGPGALIIAVKANDEGLALALSGTADLEAYKICFDHALDHSLRMLQLLIPAAARLGHLSHLTLVDWHLSRKLCHNADLNTAQTLNQYLDPNGLGTLLFRAVELENISLAQALNANPDTAMDGFSILAESVLHGIAFVRLLLDRGASVNLPGVVRGATTFLRPAIVVAAKNGHLDILALLLDRGANIETCDPHGNTALHSAAMADQVQAINFLLGKGASTAARNRDNKTPVVLAGDRGHRAAFIAFREHAGLHPWAETPNAPSALGGPWPDRVLKSQTGETVLTPADAAYWN